MPTKGAGTGGGGSHTKITNKKGTTTRGADDGADDLEDWKRSKQLLKPKDQLELTDTELKDIVVRQLTTTNPQVPQNLVEFSYAHGEFRPIPPGIGANAFVAFDMVGTKIHKDTEEARRQMLEEGIDIHDLYRDESVLLDDEAKPDEYNDENDGEEAEEEMDTVSAISTEPGAGQKDTDDIKDDDEDVEKTTTATGTTSTIPMGSKKKRKLTNQFNFCERAALTYNNPTRTQEVQTVPPPVVHFAANVLQWIIFDAYQQDYERQQKEKELERERKEKEKAPVVARGGGGGGGAGVGPVKKIAGKAQLSEAVQGRVLECWKVLERMINQNTYFDLAKDYRYWDDPADEYRDEEGTLLPLWKFNYEKTRRNTVTDIEWNPYYYDLFAVGFGYLDLMKPIEEGAVCLFTLKNPSFPDYICLTHSAVMCVDIHPKFPFMVVVGLYDGTVQVFNVFATCKVPAYQSNSIENKHRGIVWEVKWVQNLPDGELNFYSVASDGRINNWILMQNELSVTTIINLHFDGRAHMHGPDGVRYRAKSSATCVKFHPKVATIYLVGTEEGIIYKCSTAYSSKALFTYRAHNLPVYRIDFNRYNSDIFVSCSGDWKIKIWEDNRREPLFVFDVGAGVGDVKWAPYSSTVFVAVTSEGKAYCFDINVNKYKPICLQAIVPKRRNKLTRLSFNPKLPIIIVGDEKGCVTTLKLSPNLRIPCKAPKKQQHLDQWTLQCMKLDKLLSLVREPSILTFPIDTTGKEET